MFNCICSESKINYDAFKISILYWTVQNLHVLGHFSTTVLWRVNPTEEAAYEGKLISPQYLSGRAGMVHRDPAVLTAAPEPKNPTVFAKITDLFLSQSWFFYVLTQNITNLYNSLLLLWWGFFCVCLFFPFFNFFNNRIFCKLFRRMIPGLAPTQQSTCLTFCMSLVSEINGTACSLRVNHVLQCSTTIRPL